MFQPGKATSGKYRVSWHDSDVGSVQSRGTTQDGTLAAFQRPVRLNLLQPHAEFPDSQKVTALSIRSPRTYLQQVPYLAHGRSYGATGYTGSH